MLVERHDNRDLPVLVAEDAVLNLRGDQFVLAAEGVGQSEGSLGALVKITGVVLIGGLTKDQAEGVFRHTEAFVDEFAHRHGVRLVPGLVRIAGHCV